MAAKTSRRSLVGAFTQPSARARNIRNPWWVSVSTRQSLTNCGEGPHDTAMQSFQYSCSILASTNCPVVGIEIRACPFILFSEDSAAKVGVIKQDYEETGET